jgi:uncharacterized protein (UPF0371 family)
MGVNRAGFGIVDDQAIQEAAHQEIIRRYFRCACEYAMGFVEREILDRSELIMKNTDATVEDRTVVLPARQAAITAQKSGKGNEGIFCGAAIELRDGTIITGENSPLMHAASGLVINAAKHITGLPKKMHLLPKNITDSVRFLKKEVLHITHIPTTGDEAGLRKLGVNLTSDPDFSSKSLFIS